MQDVIQTYENYREEDRLSTNNARRIEFLTTVRMLDGLLGEKRAILDCAAGTGIYAFYYADRGHTVTATDLTPRHVAFMRKVLQSKPYTMQTAAADVRDLSAFADESFDVVLNMGPFYHLVEEADRQKCMQETLRVLKKGGLLVSSYIPRYAVFPYIVMRDRSLLEAAVAGQLVQSGQFRHDDETCFWTDTYYARCEEMEQLYAQYGLAVIDHFAQDGLTPLFAQQVDQWNEAEFAAWCGYHYSICRERSQLGASCHTVIVGRK